MYWDTMLLIFLLEGKPSYRARVSELLTDSLDREDELFTSYLGLGELMVGAEKRPYAPSEIKDRLNSIGFSFLSFDAACVPLFASLRAESGVKASDAIHLACAGAVGVDLFLTGDAKLLKLDVPGIHLIADFDTPLLQL